MTSPPWATHNLTEPAGSRSHSGSWRQQPRSSPQCPPATLLRLHEQCPHCSIIDLVHPQHTRCLPRENHTDFPSSPPRPLYQDQRGWKAIFTDKGAVRATGATGYSLFGQWALGRLHELRKPHHSWKRSTGSAGWAPWSTQLPQPAGSEPNKYPSRPSPAKAQPPWTQGSCCPGQLGSHWGAQGLKIPQATAQISEYLG